MDAQRFINLLDLYRDGDISVEDARALAEAIRSGDYDELLFSDIKTIGLLSMLIISPGNAEMTRGVTARLRAKAMRKEITARIKSRVGAGRDRSTASSSVRGKPLGGSRIFFAVASAAVVIIGIFFYFFQSRYHRPAQSQSAAVVKDKTGRENIKDTENTAPFPRLDKRVIERGDGVFSRETVRVGKDNPPESSASNTRGNIDLAGNADNSIRETAKVVQAAKEPTGARTDVNVEERGRNVTVEDRERVVTASGEATVGEVILAEAFSKQSSGIPGKWIKLVAGVQVKDGDSLRTRSGRCWVELGSGAVVVLNSYSTATFHAGMVELQKGEVGCEYSGGILGFKVVTKRGDVRHIGTRFSVKTTTVLDLVTVAEGRVSAENNNGTVEVAAGFQIKLPGNKPPTRPRKVDAEKRLAWMARPTGEKKKTVGPRVLGFTLINADTGQAIDGFDPIPDGSLIELDKLPSRKLNIRAETFPPRVGCVQFILDGDENFNTERGYPYSLAGDETTGGGGYKSWTPRPGEHVLTAVPYEGPPSEDKRGGSGKSGKTLTIRFRVVGR